jgi:hypothetical protein
VQVDPIKLTLKAPGNKRLKLKCDTQLSTSVFEFNLRRYSWADPRRSASASFADGSPSFRAHPPTSASSATWLGRGRSGSGGAHFQDEAEGGDGGERDAETASFAWVVGDAAACVITAGLRHSHSSTLSLNLSRFCH